MTVVVRKPVVAGTFYPVHPERLQREVEAYLKRVTIDRSGEQIIALVAPHAGYIYSGPIAACAYRQVQGHRYDTVVVISPAHRDLFDYCSVFEGRGYETPLGLIEIDQELSAALAALPEIRLGHEGHLHTGEHSLEVHLPFIQVVQPGCRLVAVVMGRQDRESSHRLGLALAEAASGRQVLIVASSDLSHFHAQEHARKLDRHLVDSIERFDPDGLLETIHEHRAEACGYGPMAAAMFAARELGASRGENLCYGTSGDTSGDFTQVVGYTAGIFYR